MRVLLAAALLGLLPTPAFADVTARYAVGNDVIVVEADDSGDYRAAIDGKATIFHRGGTDYLMLQDRPGGEAMITELSAFLALMGQVGAARSPEPGKSPVFTLAQAGEAEIDGRKGTRWTMTIDRPGEKALAAVMSSDPALAPLGVVFRRTIAAGIRFFAATVQNTGNFATVATELFAKGTPIEISGPIAVKLTSIDRAEIDPKRFELPGKPVDAETLAAAMAHAPRDRAAEAETEPLP